MAVKARPVLVIEASEMKSYTPVPPNCWQGQVDCVVGPFSSQEVAQYFARAVVEFGQYDAFIDQLFPQGDAWYLKIDRSDTGFGPYLEEGARKLDTTL